MDHGPHILLVHPHAEGAGGHHHVHLAFHEGLLVGVLHVPVHLAMEAAHGDAGCIDQVRQFLDALRAACVNDGRFVAGVEQLQQDALPGLISGVRHLHHLVGQVLPPGLADERFQFQTEPVAEVGSDVLDHLGLGRGREAGHRDGPLKALVLLQLLQVGGDVEVVHAEVMPPGREAVGLVDHEPGDVPLGQQAGQGGGAQRLRRYVKEVDATVLHLSKHLLALQRGKQPAQVRGLHDLEAVLQHLHLVLHQGYQGRDHHGERPGEFPFQQGRQLKGERLASPGGEHRQQRPAGQGGANGPFLDTHAGLLVERAEGFVAEMLLEPQDRVKPAAAVGATIGFAGGVAQLAQNGLRPGQFMHHPAGQDGRGL